MKNFKFIAGQIFGLLSYGTESQARTNRTVIKSQFHKRILTAAGKRYYTDQSGPSLQNAIGLSNPDRPTVSFDISAGKK